GTEKLSLLEKVAYGTGDFASQLIWSFTGSYLSVFYTDIVGLTPGVVAAILLGARIWDGINDPMFGAIAERTKSRWGRFRPYMIYGTPLLALLNVICFTNPGFNGNMNMRIIYAAVTYVFLGMIYTVVNLSYGALSAVMTYDPSDRTQINAFRMGFTQVGAVVLNLVSMPLILFFSGAGDGQTTNGMGYTLTCIAMGIVAIPMFYFTALVCKERVKPVAANKKTPLSQTIKTVVTNKPLMVLFGIAFFGLFMMFGRLGVALYYYMYAMQRFDLIALLMMLPSLVAAVAIFAMAKFIDKIGKKRSFIIGTAISAGALVAIYFTPFDNVGLIITFTAIYGLGMFTSPILLALVPDVIDYAEDRTGVRADGTSYAAISLSTKFASAFGGAFGLIIMGAFGYVANAEQTAQSLTGINIATNLMPAAAAVIAIVLMLAYPLNPAKNAEVRARLEAAAAAANSAGESEGVAD
ncbi:MAG: MFS transporter, partial [Bifidobacteriaceae bacterium]|nr:MFS transporter [Bifidobacteriaceae bacterium]